MSVAAELHLQEAAEALPIRADGLVPLHIIRPGIGKGRGKHLYEADMLEREAGVGRFKNWKMYLDHQDPVAKKRSAGLPRKITDLAGQVKEAWWDPNVPANPAAGHGRGAVTGLARVNRFMRSLIEDLGPEAIGVSISATASGVRAVNRGGQQVWLVEGINPRGSVDFVTEAGAGGRVVSLVEALQESLANDQEVFELLEGRDDQEVIELIRAERPELLESLLEEAMDAEDAKDGGDDELAELTKSLLKKFKGNEKLARRAAQMKLKAKTEESRREGGDVDATELLQEALDSEGGNELLETACEPIVEKLFAKIVAPRLEGLIEAALEDERELMQAEASAVADRKVALRDMRDAAHATIKEARLPEPFKVELRASYDLVEGKPTPKLDVVDDEATADAPKTAVEKVAESLAADLALKEEQFRASRPTTVVGQGARTDKPAVAKAEGEGGKGDEQKKAVEESKTTGSARTDHALREAGVEITEDLYAGITD